MLFFFGYIVGLLNAIVIVLIMFRYKHKVEVTHQVLEDKITHSGKGFIFEPDDEATEFRKEVVRKNSRKGLITKLSDLF